MKGWASWNDEKFKAWLEERDSTISEDVRLVVMSVLHVDARISALQSTCIYIAVVLTIMLGLMIYRGH